MERKVASEEEMREWCVALPKVELHAHLNGSVRNSTLLSVYTAPPPLLVLDL
jgi:adenosine deaminase